MPIYSITPQDVLMFRDGRPMEGGLSGHGARWPEPGVIFDALHAALHRAFPTAQPWEHTHRHGRSSTRDNQAPRSQRFGSLTTLGPFPAIETAAGTSTWFFPCPADVVKAERGLLAVLHPLRDAGGRSNLPAPLKYPLGNPCPPSKTEPKPWWSKNAIERYLRADGDAAGADADDLWDRELREASELYASEWNTGITIDPDTLTTGHGEAAGKIYSAEYLRLRDGVAFGIHASMPMKNPVVRQLDECIIHLFPARNIIIVGGQQRTCQVSPLDGALDQYLPIAPPRNPGSTRIKWLLLTPAVYPAIQADAIKGIRAHPGGWLPNWICPETGQVLLKAGDTERRQGESRADWRKRVRDLPTIAARLVAARIPKPIVVTGWTEALHLKDTPWQRQHGPRPTLLAVPAGAVYYFEADSPGDAARLAAALNWHGSTPGHVIVNRRSTLLGEKGYGLGVCGTWQFYDGSDPSAGSASSDRSKETQTH